MSLSVTVVDDQTGETQTGKVPDGDYMILVTAPAYVSGIQTYPMAGTHVITVKGRAGLKAADTPVIELPSDDPTLAADFPGSY